MTSQERLALLAHELRSPVAALAALVEAARGMDEPAARRRLLALGVAAGRDVERLLADPELLSVRPRPVALRELVAPAEALGATLDLAADAAAVVVHADPTRIRQLLANLVANARRHADVVRVEVETTAEAVHVDVVDDGPGLPPATDVFALGVSGAGSSGYGLWVARAIAEAHGGTLEVVPSAEGTRLRLCLARASASR